MTEIYKRKSYSGIVFGYYTYLLFVIISYALSRPDIKVFGGISIAVIVAFTVLAIPGKLDFKRSTIGIVFLFLIYSIFSSAINVENINLNDLLKQGIVYFIYIIIMASNYSIIHFHKQRKWFILLLFILIFISLMAGENIEILQGERLAGIFANPNNLALIGLALLFFIDDEKDKAFFIIAIHLTVIIVLVYSGTVGAILAYGIAMCYKNIQQIIKYKRLFITSSLFLIVLLITFSTQLSSLYVFNRVVAHFNAIRENIYAVATGVKMNYGYLLTQYGTDALSGIWRVEHWINILREYFNSSIINIIFGHGIGSIRIIFEKLAHNEYLRILFEMGIIGLSILVIFYVVVWKRTVKNFRYIILLFLIFSFSENNIDNFLYMSILMLFTATHQMQYVDTSKSIAR